MVKLKKLKNLNWGFTVARVREEIGHLRVREFVEWKIEIGHSRGWEIGKN